MNVASPLSAERLDIAIQSSDGFFDSLRADIDKTGPGDRVALTTMCFEPTEPQVDKLVGSLHAAAERDVEIHMAADAYSFLFDTDAVSVGPMLLPNSIRQGVFRRRKQALDELNEHSSVTTNVLNVPNGRLQNPFAGRSHIKAAVVNDTSYITGANLHYTHRTDTALRFESAPAADKLYDTLTQLVRSGSTRDTFEGVDQVWQLDDATQLLIDSGEPGQSAILKRALEIIGSGEGDITAFFQYFPRGVVIEALAEAAIGGVDVQAFYNHPKTQGLVGSLPEFYATWRGHKQLPEALSLHAVPATKHMHSKILATASTGMSGSHNIDTRGVAFGTAEMSVVRYEPTFARTLADFLLEQIGLARIQPHASTVDARQPLAA